MHEMGHFLGYEDLDPQASPYDLMSADLPAGVRRLPQSAVIATVAQRRNAQAQAGGHASAAAEQTQAKDAVFAALAQPQGETTQGKAAGASPTRGGCCTGRSKLGGKSVLGQPVRHIEAALHPLVRPWLPCAVRSALTRFLTASSAITAPGVAWQPYGASREHAPVRWRGCCACRLPRSGSIRPRPAAARAGRCARRGSALPAVPMRKA